MRRTPLPWTLLAVVLALAGCNSRRVTDPPIPLDVTGPVAIDVEMFAGDVDIKADPAVEQPHAVVVRESTHGQMRKEEAVASLEQISYSVDLTGSDLGQVIRVRASTEHAEPYFQRVNVQIRVPEVEGVTVRTRSGDVKAIDVQGPIDITTSDGHVIVATNKPLLESIRITNDFGDIDLRCRSESSGELDFHAEGGQALSRIMRGQTVVHPGTNQHTVLASFNDGSNPIVLRTASGNIRFVVVEEPLEYGMIMAD